MFGVLHNNLLLTANGETVINRNLWIKWMNLEHLFQICRDHKIKQLWITPESGFWKSIKAEMEIFQSLQQIDFLSDSEKSDLKNSFWSSEKFEYSPKKPFSKNTVTGWIPGEYKKEVQIIFCGLTSEDWEFDKVADPYVLFNSIEIFTDKLGVLPSFPNRTAITFLKSTIARKFETEDHERMKVFLEKRESEILWLRNPTAKERQMKFVRAYDKRMMFLSACSSLNFGEGEFEVIENCKFSDFKKDWQGLCEVDFKYYPKVSEPFFRDFLPENGKYYTTYLRLLSEHTKEIHIKKAWIFKDTKKTFEKFYKKLSLAIKETRFQTVEAVAANKSLKSIYTQFFGWLGRQTNQTGFASELFRPDWRGLIVSQANVNLLHNAQEVFKKTGKTPFGIYHDCLMYFCNDKSEFEETCLHDQNRFSHEWTLAAVDVLKLIETGANVSKIDKAGKESNV